MEPAMPVRRLAAHVVLSAIALSVLAGRVILGMTLRPWYAFDQGADDRLLVDQAIGAAGRGYGYALAKDQGYAWLLRAAHILGVDVTTLHLSMLVVAAGLAALAAGLASRRAWPALVAWTAVLCWPGSLDDWLGLRVYRNTVFFPVMTMLVSLTVLMVVCASRPGWMVGAWLSAGPAGGLAAWMGMLKEDAVWMAPALTSILIVLMILGCRRGLPVVTRLAVMLTVVLALTAGGLGWSTAERYMEDRYGVSYLNMRTSGPLAGFVERLTLIDAPGRTGDVWAPPKAIERAFDVADTLDAYPGIRTWMLSDRGYAQPLRGDFVGWQLVNAVSHSDLGWDDPARVATVFDRANREIDRAFADGTLTRAPGFRPVGSLPALDPADIPDLMARATRTWVHAWVPFDLFVPSRPATDGYFRPTPMPYGRFQGLEYLGVDPGDPLPQPFPWMSHGRAVDWSRTVNRVWTPVALLALLALPVAPILTALRIRRSGRRPFLLALAAWPVALYGWAYCLAAVWYAGWLHSPRVEFFYTAGLVAPLTGAACLMAWCALIASVRIQRGHTVSEG